METEFGLEDWVGVLEFVEGVLENLGVGGFGEEEGEDCYARAAWRRPAPAELGVTDRPDFGFDAVEWRRGEGHVW